MSHAAHGRMAIITKVTLLPCALIHHTSGPTAAVEWRETGREGGLAAVKKTRISISSSNTWYLVLRNMLLPYAFEKIVNVGLSKT